MAGRGWPKEGEMANVCIYRRRRWSPWRRTGAAPVKKRSLRAPWGRDVKAVYMVGLSS